MTDGWKLIGMTPDGKRIVKSYEVGDGWHSVRHFVVSDDDGICAEYGDEFMRHDPETASFRGEPLYLDEEGRMWPERSISFVNGQGLMMRSAVQCTSMSAVSIKEGVDLALRCNSVAADARGLGRKDWNATAEGAGWDESVKVIHLEGLIEELGLMPVLAAYGRRVAKEESAEMDMMKKAG